MLHITKFNLTAEVMNENVSIIKCCYFQHRENYGENCQELYFHIFPGIFHNLMTQNIWFCNFHSRILVHMHFRGEFLKHKCFSGIGCDMTTVTVGKKPVQQSTFPRIMLHSHKIYNRMLTHYVARELSYLQQTALKRWYEVEIIINAHPRLKSMTS